MAKWLEGDTVGGGKVKPRKLTIAKLRRVAKFLAKPQREKGKGKANG